MFSKLVRLRSYLCQSVSIAPLVMFRIIFGLMVFLSTLRFIINGWVFDLYVAPKFFFSYDGFDWVKPFGGIGMYIVFSLMLLSSIGIVLGYRYKVSAIIFFLLFTYVELIDKTNYLNHYYFVSLVSFLLIIVPAGNSFSLDVRSTRIPEYTVVPRWTIDIFKFQLGIVYFFAGIAKLNYHWLIEAQPLANWLKHQTDLLLIGSFMKYKATAFIFAWGGALYDLLIPFILLSKKWRLLGYILVIIFHVLTAAMFPIGVFPFVMIGSTLIFFSPGFHQKSILFISKILRIKRNENTINNIHIKSEKFTSFFLLAYISVQLLLPFRYLLYPGKLFWTEQGYRFSWRVMLIEKAGYAEFHVKNEQTGGGLVVDNSNYLTPQQEKMMATQPDMILQYAHYLRDQFKDSSWQEGSRLVKIDDPIITVNASVSLFNQGSKTFIDPNINLAKQKRGWHHKNWVYSYE